MNLQASHPKFKSVHLPIYTLFCRQQAGCRMGVPAPGGGGHRGRAAGVCGGGMHRRDAEEDVSEQCFHALHILWGVSFKSR